MITVIGSLNMDLVTYTEHFPMAGETITSYQYSEIPGGKGANQAVTIGKLGGEIQMIGAIGSDSFGQSLLDNLSVNHVGISGIKRLSDTPTGMAFINVADCSDNKIILVPGANESLSIDDILAHKELIANSDLIILQLEIPLETVRFALRLAHEMGKTTLLNPAPACPLDNDLLSYVDILTPNETELALLTNSKIDTLDDISHAANKLIANGVGTVIVTIGEKGAIIVKENLVIHSEGHHVDAIDTTAAGDSFTGALALSLTQGRTLEDSVVFANKVASITVQRKGAQVSLPTLAEVKSYFNICE